MGMFGSSPQIPEPTPPPAGPDVTAIQIAGIQKAETDRRLRESRGRRSTFLFDDLPRTAPRPSDGGRPPGSTPTLGG